MYVYSKTQLYQLENNRFTIQRRLEYVGLKKKDIYTTETLKTKSSKSVVEISEKLSVYYGLTVIYII